MRLKNYIDRHDLTHNLLDLVVRAKFNDDRVVVAFVSSITFFSMALADFTELKGIRTFKKLLKLYKEVIDADVKYTIEVLKNRQITLNEFKFISTKEKTEIETYLKGLSFAELSELALLDNRYLSEEKGFNYNDLEPKEVYKLTYASFLWVDMKTKADITQANDFLNITFDNDSIRKKADRLAERISETFYNFTLSTKTEEIERPKTDNNSIIDASFMVESHGIRTDKLTSDFQVATRDIDKNSPIYEIIATRDAQSKTLLEELGRLETENKSLTSKSDKYNENLARINEIRSAIDKLTENYIFYRNTYTLIDSQQYKTSLNLDIEGFYNFKDSEGNQLAIIPPRVIKGESKDYDRVFKAIIGKALYKAPHEIVSEFDFTISDIAEMMGLDRYDDYNILTKAEQKQVERATETFISVVRFELEQVILDRPYYKGRFLRSREIGKDFKKGIHIEIFKDYLDVLVSEGKGNYYNIACEDLKSKNAITMYKEICREVFINRNKTLPDEYNYCFTLQKLRSLGKYQSLEIIKQTLTNKTAIKTENDNVKKKIKRDLKLLADNGLIFITKLKDKSVFTIYPIIETKSKVEQKETFYKLADANGHDTEN